MSDLLPSDELVQTLTLPGAMLVADSTVLDQGDMKIIALKVLAHEFRKLRLERDEAIDMLADWCLRVDKVGTGWDDWDEGYKNAMYRPCGIRELIDAAKKRLEPEYER